MKPYKVVSQSRGHALIVDRATGAKIGEVVRGSDGWQGFIDGVYPPVAVAASRAGAAVTVWAMSATVGK